MGQFTVYRNLNPASREAYPYFVDVQSELLDALSTRLVIPLVRAERLRAGAIERLCLEVSIQAEPCVLLTHQMTNVPAAALKSPIDSLRHLRSRIVSAIDFLVTGI